MGLFEKRRYKQFLSYVDQYEVNIEKTHKNYDCTVKTMKECYDLFGLDDNTAGYNGHGLALFLDDRLIIFKILFKFYYWLLLEMLMDIRDLESINIS